MRTRRRGSEVPLVVGFGSKSRSGRVDAWEDPGYPEPNMLFRTTTRSDVETMVDTVMPGYFKAKRDSEVLAVNPMSKDVLSWEDTSSLKNIWRERNYTYESGGESIAMRQLYRYTFDGFPRWATPQHLSVSLPSEATMVQEALAKAKSDLWDVKTFLAEFSKTASMVQTLFAKVLVTVKIIRRAIKERRPDTIGKTFAQIWLEGRYGWRPTYYDLKDAHQAWQRLAKVAEPMIRRTESAEDSASPQYGQWARLNPAPAFSIEYRTITVTSAKRRAGVGLQHFTGIPVSWDPWVTAWEIVPWSFVVDWFFTIGSALQAHSPFSRGQLQYAWVSTVKTTTVSHELRWSPQTTDGWTYSPLLGTLMITRETTTRDPVTQPAIDLSFYPKLSLGKVIDLAALTAVSGQSRSGLHRRR